VAGTVQAQVKLTLGHNAAVGNPKHEASVKFADIVKEKSGGMFVVSETQMKYHAPARLDDLLEVTAQTLNAGRASLVLSQQAWHGVGVDRKLLAEGTIRIGWVDSQSMKPGRIPAAILEALQ
jgi:acyl-CoA thioester hydrolase